MPLFLQLGNFCTILLKTLRVPHVILTKSLFLSMSLSILMHGHWKIWKICGELDCGQSEFCSAPWRD